MNVVVVGSGGREHALAWKISESKSLKKLFVLPGNPGTAAIAENINIDLSGKESAIEFCKDNAVDLVVIGPEQPLVDGLANALRSVGILVFGPNSSAAEIEAHKTFAKHIMSKAGIPTGKYIEFNAAMYDRAVEYLKKKKYPCVIKADGLASGKGVLICKNSDEAIDALKTLFIKKVFGKSGEKILIEEFLEGEEASVFAITDGNNFILLPPSQDHKRIGDNDTGKNTGGMGAYAPAPIVTSEIMEFIASKIVAPTLHALNAEGRKFIGCLYVGLMLTDEGPKVVEYNCRFGDPETQAVLPLIKGDFLKLLYSAAKGELDRETIKYNNGSSVCVVAASDGYPGAYKKGFEITGLEQMPENVIVFHAGTKEENGKIVTNGGRVLGVTSMLKENDLAEAKRITYDALKKIHFENIYYRTDIADKALK